MNKSTTCATSKKILLFELNIVGHHAGYIRHLLNYWNRINIELVIIVSPDFLKVHKEIVALPTKGTVKWYPITTEDAQWYESSKYSILRHTWAEWKLFCRYASIIKPDHAIVMYLDRFQLPLALRLPAPCAISGIYFRPKFHYKTFTNHPPDKKAFIHALREKWFWRSALRHPKFSSLFCLDPYAIKTLQLLSQPNKVFHLADPVETYSKDVEKTTLLGHKLGLDPQRKVLLLFGMLDRRKGIYELLEALPLLSSSQQAQLTLLLAGPLAERDKTAIKTLIATLTKNLSVQICLDEQFIKEEHIQPYFDLADVVSVLYQRHVGMSAILVRAAAAKKPVLASNYGLVGELVQQHQLGAVIDSASPIAIKEGIVQFLEGNLRNTFSKELAKAFANKNTPKQFAETLVFNINKV